jgi:histidinol-phosphate aminotransferase
MTTQLSRRSLLRRLGAGATMSLGIAPLARAASAERETSEPTVDVGDNTAGPVRLHKNESAFGPSAAVVAAIRAASASVVTRYPETADAMLRRKLADLHRVSPDQIVLGCGSDDVLGMAIAAFGAGRKVVVADPTYDTFVDCARRNGADVNAVPLRGDYTHDLEAMLTRADASTALVYVCNPNNPTGSLTRRRDLEAFIAKLPPSSYILMDEAYHHYVGGSSDYASFIDRPVNDPRVIVTRSFSTVHGLGGLRVGYAVASLDAAARMEATGFANNLNAVAALAAIAALDDTDHVRGMARQNVNDRQEFANQANARMLRVVDSQANFVLLNTGRPAADMVAHFTKNGVLVAGPFRGFDKHIRVSLGSPNEMREFWRVWDLMPANHVMPM